MRARGGYPPLFLMLQCRPHEAAKQRMRPVGPGFQFWVGLGADEEGMVFQLDHFHDTPVGRQAGQSHAFFFQYMAVGVVYLVAVPVALVDFFSAVEPISQGISVQYTGIGAQAQGTADILHTVLVGHQVDHGMDGAGIDLDRKSVV